MSVRIAIIVFILISVINSYFDLKTMQVSLILNYVGITVCTVLLLINSPQLFIKNLLGSVILFLVFIFVWKITNKGLGVGDIHYSIFCGLITGFPICILSGLLASIIGLLVFLFIKLVSKKSSLKNLKIPFIPIIFLGSLFGFIFSNHLFK